MKKLLSWLLVSRRRVIMITLVALLVVDIGRSIYGRVGYAVPAEPWQEAPYQAIAWPPGSDLSSEAPIGQRVYIERCSICHGPEGRGNGPAAPSLIPRPRDFTLGSFKYKSTPEREPPTDDDLIRTIRDGLQASAMPYFGDLLTEEEIIAVVEYIKDFSSIFEGSAPEPISIPPRVSSDDSSIARGEALFNQFCTPCHGDNGRAMVTFRDEKGYPVIARDLTASWTFRGGSNPEDLWVRLTTGLSPAPMPAFNDEMTPEERWDVVNYLLSITRTPPWEMGGTLQGPGHNEDLRKRGEYLVHLEMCGLCHTQINADMIYSGDEYYLAGGMAIQAYPQDTFVSRNLTSDSNTGLGKWTVEEIANAIRNGEGKERFLNFWGMPWMFLHTFEPEDALATATYLKSRSAVTNKIPLPLKYGFVESVIAKILYSTSVPPLGNPTTLTYKQGNYGQTQPGMLSPGWPQRMLIGLQWLILLGGAVAFVIATPSEKRRPSGVRGWIRAVFSLLGLLILCLVLWVIYSTPVLPFVPPEQINLAATSGIHQPDPAQLVSPEDAALAARGEYLFTVTSCAYCHGDDGSGGAKISMRTFGTLWARNITPDLETGIGSWTDDEIARAIRSGISKGGRQLHWQGMTWDHLSNLDEEDVRAIIVYLGTLPPVRNDIPNPVPPSPNDCEEYTFFLIDSWTPGCAP